ncbi:hypothetical protein ACOCTW_004579, partial [Escherichia coli]
CRESHFSAYLTLWFPLLIWWTPLCLIRQILTRRFRLYAYKKYGRLNKDAWRDDSRQRFKEAFRVLRPHGVLIF